MNPIPGEGRRGALLGDKIFSRKSFKMSKNVISKQTIFFTPNYPSSSGGSPLWPLGQSQGQTFLKNSILLQIGVEVRYFLKTEKCFGQD
jgi:hypothetical protein